MKIQRVGPSIQQNESQKPHFQGVCKIYEDGLSVLLDGRPKVEKSLKMFQRIVEKFTDGGLEVLIGHVNDARIPVENTKHSANIKIIFIKNHNVENFKECGFYLNTGFKNPNQNTTNLFQTLKDFAGEHLNFDYLTYHGEKMKKTGDCQIEDVKEIIHNPRLKDGLGFFKTMVEKLTNLSVKIENMPKDEAKLTNVSSYEKARDMKPENLKLTYNKQKPVSAGFYWNSHENHHKNIINIFQNLKDNAGEHLRWEGLLEKSDLSRRRPLRKNIYSIDS